MQHVLYGDGIHDDLPAIQELLDSGKSCVYLPPASKFYKICGTIRIHSYQELRLDRYTVIRLGEHCDCAMLTNAEKEEWNSHISVCGGIWDMNHSAQSPNPAHFPVEGLLSKNLAENGFVPSNRYLPKNVYTGFCFIFSSIRHFYLGNLTIVNPVVYGADLAYVEDFTVENIDFEYTEGSPKLWNLDGIHIEAGCQNGVVRNLKGACHDDTVAITSDDLFSGPIRNITVDGIYADGSHSAVRLLSKSTPVENIHITNVFGSYYVYAIILSDYSSNGSDHPIFENITIDNIYASLCPGTVDVPGNYEPLISIRSTGVPIHIRELTLSRICRTETHLAQPTIRISENVTIDALSVSDCVQTNRTGTPFPFIQCNGTIGKLFFSHIDTGADAFCEGNGTFSL